jgi:hypothetical protein
MRAKSLTGANNDLPPAARLKSALTRRNPKGLGGRVLNAKRLGARRASAAFFR